MSINSNLRPIAEIIEDLKASAADDIVRSKERIERNLAENIATLEKNRAILPALEAIVGEEALQVWYSGREAVINLGMKPTKGAHKKAAFARKLLAISTALSKVSLYYKDTSGTEDAKKGIVSVYLTAKAYPGIQIRYKQKLPKHGVKCRIVKDVSYRLLCTS